MQTLLLSREEVARRAKMLYEQSIRARVEAEGNIGEMVIIDIETGDFAVDEQERGGGRAAAGRLQ